MARKRLVLILLLLGLLVTACSPRAENQSEPATKKEEAARDKEVAQDPLWEKIDSMDLDEKIGQLIIVGYEGRDYNEDLDRKLKELRPGGIIFFRENIGDARATISSLNRIKEENKKLGNIPLFLAVDQEGGSVSRLPEDLEKTLAAEEIGRLENMELIEEAGELLNKPLEELGFNMNNGLVLDIKTDPNSKLIGSRAFGSDDQRVIRSSKNFLRGMEKTSLVNVGKHFPGHGATAVDSHYRLPIVRKTRQELDYELGPFKEAIDQGLDGLMVGHILLPEIDEFPASISEVFLKDIIREQLGFQGLILSDDMTMGAITNGEEPDDAAIKFIKNGGDLALLCFGQDYGYGFKEKLLKELEENRISEEEIDRKLYRILKLKSDKGIEDQAKSLDIDLEAINTRTRQLNHRLKNSEEEEQKWEAD